MGKSILDILDLVSDLKSIEEQRFNQILNFKEEFCSKLSIEKEKLPYNINLLDEIHANENAHSRIFVKFMQYSDRGKHKLLESFLQSLGEPFNNLKFTNLEIIAEKNRIDAGIRDKNRSKTIIIENKIHGASDREKQIERYINIEKNDGYDESNIYVLYLTKTGGHPSEESLSKERKESLNERYKGINYKNDILPWLNDISWSDKQWENTKNIVILKSAVIQYIDYLEGMFLQRKGEAEMKNEIIDLVKKKFAFNSNESHMDQLKMISDYKEYISELEDYFDMLKIETIFSALMAFEKKLQKEFLKDDICFVKENANVLLGKKESGIYFEVKGWNKKFLIRLEFENELENLFIGIYNSNNDSSVQLIKEFTEIFNGRNNDPNEMWPYATQFFAYQKDDFVNAIGNGELLSEIINHISEIISKTKGVNDLFGNE